MEEQMREWYVSPSEFAALCVTAIEDGDYFKRNEKHHPEDISNAFLTVAPAIALGITFAGRAAEPKVQSLYAGTVEATVDGE
jgi:hypothetical protein